jgi:hypothetical protein
MVARSSSLPWWHRIPLCPLSEWGLAPWAVVAAAAPRAVTGNDIQMPCVPSCRTSCNPCFDGSIRTWCVPSSRSTGMGHRLLGSGPLSRLPCLLDCLPAVHLWDVDSSLPTYRPASSGGWPPVPHAMHWQCESPIWASRYVGCDSPSSFTSGCKLSAATMPRSYCRPRQANNEATKRIA